MDWGAAHLTIIVGTRGGAFTNKNCPQGRAFEQFFQMPGVCPGIARGGCSRMELTRTLRVPVSIYESDWSKFNLFRYQ